MKRVKRIVTAAVFLILIFSYNYIRISLEEAQPPNMMLVVRPAPASDVLADSTIGQATSLLHREGEPASCLVIVEPATCAGENCQETQPIFECVPEDSEEPDIVWMRTKMAELSLKLLSTAFSARYYTGSQLWITTSYPGGCSGGYYQLPSLDSDWDNKISSVQTNTGANCHSTTLYDYAGYGGASITASPNLSVLGAMDNAASSLKVFP